MLYLKAKARISGRTWQAVINITKLGREVSSRKGVKRTVQDLAGERTYEKFEETLRVMLCLKTKARISGRTWQAVINITKLGRTGVNKISLHFRLVNLKGRNCCQGKGKSLDCALDYPDKLITVNSFPWLPYNAHKRCSTNKKTT